MPIGTHVPHAAGLAWGEKLKGNSTVAIAYFGDGATSEGAFHEGANLAAVMQAPLILFCNNNQWAISTPLEAQTRAATLADKAVGYGMPGVRVDGGDVLAVYEATREAVERDAPAAGRRSSRRSRTARRRTRPPTTRARTSTSTGSRRRSETSAWGVTTPISGGSESWTMRSPRRSRTRHSRTMRQGIAAAEAEPGARSGAGLRQRLRPPAAEHA